MGSIDSWNSQVKSHIKQSESVLAEADRRESDSWRQCANIFRMDPGRTDDKLLNSMLNMVDPGSSVLDVGGGAGRFALPLALKGSHVTVVEPSASMVEQMRESAKEAGSENLSIVQESWEQARVDEADVVLCAHVVYRVADIEPFLHKLNAHAKRSVILLSFVRSPMAGVVRLWEPVHGEKGEDLPAMRELLEVMWEMGIFPDVRMVRPDEFDGPYPPYVFESSQSALTQLRSHLHVSEGSAQDKLLRTSLGELLIDVAGGVGLSGIGPVRQGFMSWSPGCGRAT